MDLRSHPLLITLLLATGSGTVVAASDYESTVWPVLERYCIDCHGPTEHKAELNFESFKSASAFDAEPELLDKIIWVIEEGEMPPVKSPQPGAPDKQAVLAWMSERFAALQHATPGDPGAVVMARLNSAEYNHVIRDLTGHDLNPAEYFTSDASSTIGFTNNGAHLAIEPVRIENYLQGAKWVLSHAMATPGRGLVWYPDPVVAGTPEKQLAILGAELAEWHAAQEKLAFTPPTAAGSEGEDKEASSFDSRLVNIGEYLYIAWQYQHRAELGRPHVTLAELAAETDGRCIPIVAERWVALLAKPDGMGHVSRYLQLFDAIPGPTATSPAQAREWCDQMAEVYHYCLKPERWFEVRNIPLEKKLVGFKPKWETSFASEPLTGKLEFYLERGFPDWAIDFRERATYRAEIDLKQFPGETLYVVVTDAWDGAEGDRVKLEEGLWHFAGGRTAPVELPADDLISAPATLPLAVPEGAERFTLTARLSDQDKKQASVQIAFLDRAPVAWEQHYLPGRQLIAWPQRRGRINTRMHHETALFGSLVARSSNPIGRRRSPNWLLTGSQLPPAKLTEFGFGPSATPPSPYYLTTDDLLPMASAEARAKREALLADFDLIAQTAEATTHPRLDATAEQILRATLRFLWRRDVSEEAFAHYYDIYRRTRAEGESFDASIKRPLAIAMVSPQFLFKTREIRGQEEIVPLGAYDLANRLSFFLWASAPDARLLDLARDGSLLNPDVLSAEARRMLTDPRARALGAELAGRWLGFNRFDLFTQPDMDKFPTYTPELREAMYEEAIQTFVHLFTDNRPLRDLVRADYLWINEPLAEHYGIPGVSGPEIRRVGLTPEQQTQRGGIFGMGALLTVTSTPLRSSPIYRGVWVLDRVLGTPTPEAPPLVPTLSQDERSQDGLPIHLQLARHREDPGCAVCHNRIDPPGLALEFYDAIGRWRAVDAAGEPVFAKGVLRTGEELEGLEGLRRYIEKEMPAFETQFARKMLAYALGRNPQFSDRPLLEEMVAAMRADGGRPFAALDVLIRSKPFRYQRTTSQEPAPLAQHP